MENLIIDATDETPGIILNPATDKFVFYGRSLPENVTSFYAPVIKWLDEYIKNSNPETIVEFQLEYFNTASSKIFLDILCKFAQIQSLGKKIRIKWYSKPNDFDMEEAGEEYSEIIEIPFEHVSY